MANASVTDSNVVVKLNTLENYDASNKELSLKSSLESALKQKFKEQFAIIEALKDFLQKCIAEKKLWAPIADRQDLYFSKKEAKDFVKILLQLQPKTDQKSLSGYVDKAFQKLDISKYTFTEKEKDSFKRTVFKELEQVEKKVDALAAKNETNSESTSAAKKTSDKPNASEAVVLTDIKKLELDFSRKFKKKLKLPKLKLKSTFSFLQDNVFSNFRTAVKSHNFTFTDLSGKLIEEKAKKGYYNKFGIWNPKISDLKTPFDDFTSKWTWEASYQIKDSIRRFAKKYTKKLVGFLDMFFPFVFTFKVLKFGFKLAKGLFGFGSKVFSFVYKTASKGLSYISSGFKFVTSTIKKVGGTTVKYLKKTLDKVSNLGLFKFTKKILFGFLQTPVGAFVLGYIVGTIYKSVKKLLNFISKVKTFIVEKFTYAKEILDKYVITPYINPILDWLQKKEEAGEFYFEIVKSVFGDKYDKEEKSFGQRITTLINLFSLRDGEGHALGLIQDTVDGINGFYEFVQKLTLENIGKFALQAGGRMVGGLIGSSIGGMLGLIPGLGIILGPIGGIIGGWLGEKVAGGIIDLMTEKSKIKTDQKSEESELDKFIRQNLGGKMLTEYAESSFGDMGRSRSLSSAISLGEIAKTSLDLEKEPGLEKFSRDWGINLKAKLAGADTAERTKLIDDIRDLSKIGNISYPKIQKEISDSIAEMTQILDRNGPEENWRDNHGKYSPRGFMTWTDIISLGNPDNYLNTAINLKGTKQRFSFTKDELEGSAINPYWLKISRTIAYLNAYRALQAKQITPFQFLEIARDLDNFNLNKFLANNSEMKLNIGTENNVSISDLIKGQYFRKGMFDSDYDAYVKNKRINYVDAWGSALNAAVFPVAIVKRILGADADQASFRWQELDKLAANERFEFLNKVYGTFPSKDKIIGYIPLKNDGWHVFSKRLMEERDVSNVLGSGAIRFNAVSLGGGFKDAYQSAMNGLKAKNIDRQKLDILNEDEIGHELYRVLGEGAQEKFAALSAEQQQGLVEEIMEQAVSENGNTGQYIGEAMLAKVSSVVSGLSGEDSEQRLQEFQEALKNIQNGEGEGEGIGLTLDEYMGLVSDNKEWMDETLIPRLKEIAKNIGVSADRVTAMFFNPQGEHNPSPIGPDMTNGTTEQL